MNEALIDVGVFATNGFGVRALLRKLSLPLVQGRCDTRGLTPVSHFHHVRVTCRHSDSIRHITVENDGVDGAQSTYRGKYKYDAATAADYQKIDPRKQKAEMNLVDAALARLPRHDRLLDVPCGGGRVALRAAGQGFAVTAADISDTMLEITRHNADDSHLDITVDKQDIESLDYPERSFDASICFRFFHHLPTSVLRQRVVEELCRVSGQAVMISYLSDRSVTSWKHRLLSRLSGRRSRKYACSLAELSSYFATCGFHLVRDFARAPVLHSLHLALFARLPVHDARGPNCATPISLSALET